MSVGVGVIGLGIMGATHLRLLATQVSGAHVAAVCDADAARAHDGAAASGGTATTDPFALIARDDVDAVLVASPDATHEACVMACIERGKPVLCEKPLADSVEACHRIVAAEAALPRPLVQVGFMRRFDPSYERLKASFAAGAVGQAVLLHCTHRNAKAPGFFDLSMTLGNAMVHDFDVARWTLGTEIARIRVDQPRDAAGRPLADPLLATLETTGGTLVSIETYMNAGYGYDIRTELVGTEGTLQMQPLSTERLRRDGRESFVHVPDFNARFADAYRRQAQAWVDAIARSQLPAPDGAAAVDGLRALEIAQAGRRALATGTWTEVAPTASIPDPARAAR